MEKRDSNRKEKGKKGRKKALCLLQRLIEGSIAHFHLRLIGQNFQFLFWFSRSVGIPGLGRFPGEGNGNPLQYSCLEHPMDRGAWRATVCGVARVGHDWRAHTQMRSQLLFLLGWTMWHCQLQPFLDIKKWQFHIFKLIIFRWKSTRQNHYSSFKKKKIYLGKRHIPFLSP